MKAEVIAVGTELLLGQIPNTNAQWISVALSEAGVDVLFHTTVGDNLDRLAVTVGAALQRADAVIITGGLGPTHDDLTREAIAEATGHELLSDPALEEWLRELFESRGRRMAPSNLRQAMLPRGAESIPNELGTAPGIALEIDGHWIFAVPGVPAEMKPMIRDFVAPRLAAMAGGGVLVSRTLKAAGIGESDLAERIAPTIESLGLPRGRDSHFLPIPTIALLASAGEVRIRITAKAPAREAALTAIAPIEEDLRERLGFLIFGADEETLEGVIASLATQRGVTVGVAESFTGGLVASRLVSVPGASKFFKGGFIAYSSDMKKDALGVAPELVTNVVSADVAIAIAIGARDRTGASVAIGTTGEAGPVSATSVPIGTVFIALAYEGGSVVRSFVAPGNRDMIRRWGAQAALNVLRLWLLGGLGGVAAAPRYDLAAPEAANPPKSNDEIK